MSCQSCMRKLSSTVQHQSTILHSCRSFQMRCVLLNSNFSGSLCMHPRPSKPCPARSTHQQQRRQRQRRLTVAAASNSLEVNLTQPDGKSISMGDEDVLSIGSAADADLRVDGPNVEPRHARLERRSGRVFCTALTGNEDDFLSDTFSWLDDSQMRHGVAYLVAPNCSLAFGEKQHSFTVQFEEKSSASPAMEMLMTSMASQGSEEVKKQMEVL